MKNIFSALDYLQKNNVVHRDLKPENLILASKDNDYEVIIADFGLSTTFKKGNTQLFTRCGSPGYVAPEILTEDGYNDAVDAFSAGVIMHVLLTGRPVFRGHNLNQILMKNR